MTDRAGTGNGDDAAELSPQESMALIGAQDRATRRALQIDDRLLYLTWGVAWLVAYGTTYLVFPHVSDPDASVGPVWLVAVAWPVAIGAAMAVTFRHVHSRRAGLADTSGGSLFGLAYLVGTAAGGVTGSVLPRVLPNVDPGLASIAPSVCIVLVIGTIYLVSGALWGDRLQVVVGTWLIAVNVVSIATGADTYSLGMAIGGGGGFLVAALAAWRRDQAVETVPAR